MGMDDFDRDVYCLAGLPFDAVGMEGAVSRLRGAAAEKTPCFLSTPNLNFLIGAQTDAPFRDSVIHSDLSVADGMPVVWMARLLGIPIRQRVAGSSLFEHLCADGGGRLSVYFFGGPDGVAEAASHALNAKGGGLKCVGFQSPGFISVATMSEPGRIDAINASGADFLVVALGARKGQEWIERNRHQITVPLISHLGAVVNFVAGTVSRAPLWMQRSGLEWLWRIKEEPALWRRYWQDGLGLLGLLIKRVLPYAIWLELNRRRGWQGGDPPPARLEREPGACRLLIEGVVDGPVTQQIRAILRAACVEEMPVIVDVSATRFAGPGFFGLLLLFKKNLDARGQALRIVGADSRMKRLFRWNGVEHLLG